MHAQVRWKRGGANDYGHYYGGITSLFASFLIRRCWNVQGHGCFSRVHVLQIVD